MLVRHRSTTAQAGVERNSMEEWMKLIPKLYKSLLKTVGHAWPRSPDLLYDHFESGRLHFNFVMHHVQATSEPGTAHVLPSRMTSNQLWDVLQSYVHGQAWDTLDHLICIYVRWDCTGAARATARATGSGACGLVTSNRAWAGEGGLGKRWPIGTPNIAVSV